MSRVPENAVPVSREEFALTLLTLHECAYNMQALTGTATTVKVYQSENVPLIMVLHVNEENETAHLEYVHDDDEYTEM